MPFEINLRKFFKAILTPNKRLRDLEVKFSLNDYLLFADIVTGRLPAEQVGEALRQKLADELGVTVGDLQGFSNVQQAVKRILDGK